MSSGVYMIELKVLLRQMISTQRQLLVLLVEQQTAMSALDAPKLEQLSRRQEEIRQHIAQQETRRKYLVMRLSSAQKPTLAALAQQHPDDAKELLQLRDGLREAIETVRHRSAVSGKLAGAVLGHLNQAVRLLAGAVQRAGVYTRSGQPNGAARLGVLNAVA